VQTSAARNGCLSMMLTSDDQVCAGPRAAGTS
jgi:hypothetical protein